MSLTKTTQPAAGALAAANPGKRNHEQSGHPEPPHAEQRPSKKAKQGTQKAAVTAAKTAEEGAAQQNDHHWVMCDECLKWRLVQNEIIAEHWQCRDDGRDCNELEDETEGL